MDLNAVPVQRLIDQFRRLPGVGKKSAQRMAFYLLALPKAEGLEFADAVRDACEKVRRCSVCCNLTSEDICPICSSVSRDRTVVCVVEDPEDLIAIEKSGTFKGTYHVLGGVISPLNGISPDDLNIGELLARLSPDNVREVILATNSDVEGEATAIYLSRLIKPLGVKVTRLANGLPVGADLQYADQVTLQRALDGRQEV